MDRLSFEGTGDGAEDGVMSQVRLTTAVLRRVYGQALRLLRSTLREGGWFIGALRSKAVAGPLSDSTGSTGERRKLVDISRPT